MDKRGVVVKKELYLNQEEYELLTRLLCEEGVKSKNNLDINEVLDIISGAIYEKERTESSWADDLDWNTRIFLHCQGEIDLTEKGEDATEERNLLRKVDSLWSSTNDVFLDMVLDKDGELWNKLVLESREQEKARREKEYEAAYKRTCKIKKLKNKGRNKTQIIKELKITENEYLKANRRIKTIERYIQFKNEGMSDNEIREIFKSKKWMKPGVERCKYYIEMNPGLFE